MLFLSVPEAPPVLLGTPGQGMSLAWSLGGVATPSVRTKSCLKSCSKCWLTLVLKFQIPKHKKFYFSLVAQCAYINKRIKGATVRVVGKKLTLALED